MFGRRKREEVAAAEAARESERRALFERLAQRPENICPFLGLEDERAGYVDGVSDEHRCFAFGDPAPLSAEQQTRVCQERGYGNCPRYLRGVLVIPTSELEALRQRRAPQPEAPAAGKVTGLTSQPAEAPKLTTPPPPPIAVPRPEPIEPEGGRTEWDKLQEERAKEGPRFSAFLWVGMLLLLVALAAVGAYAFRDQLGLVPPAPTATPRVFATPTPSPTPSPTPVPTPLATPPPIAWEWVECEPGAACESEVVIRDQMANFLARAFELAPVGGEDAFVDIAGNPYREQINAVATAGLTLGCTPTEYCPSGQVTMEQMATFIQRAFRIPSTDVDYFTDDDDSPHERAINAIREAGIAAGCGDGLFCPRQLVTRGEMAGFLSRAQALSN